MKEMDRERAMQFHGCMGLVTGSETSISDKIQTSTHILIKFILLIRNGLYLIVSIHRDDLILCKLYCMFYIKISINNNFEVTHSKI
jgi:hypothetical protein